MKKIIILLVISLLSTTSLSAETIFLKDGTSFDGTIIQGDEQSLNIRTIGGNISLQKEKIGMIDFPAEADNKEVESAVFESTRPLKGLARFELNAKFEASSIRVIDYDDAWFPVFKQQSGRYIQVLPLNIVNVNYKYSPDVSLGIEFGSALKELVIDEFMTWIEKDLLYSDTPDKLNVQFEYLDITATKYYPMAPNTRVFFGAGIGQHTIKIKNPVSGNRYQATLGFEGDLSRHIFFGAYFKYVLTDRAKWTSLGWDNYGTVTSASMEFGGGLSIGLKLGWKFR